MGSLSEEFMETAEDVQEPAMGSRMVSGMAGTFKRFGHGFASFFARDAAGPGAADAAKPSWRERAGRLLGTAAVAGVLSVAPLAGAVFGPDSPLGPTEAQASTLKGAGQALSGAAHKAMQDPSVRKNVDDLRARAAQMQRQRGAPGMRAGAPVQYRTIVREKENGKKEVVRIPIRPAGAGGLMMAGAGRPGPQAPSARAGAPAGGADLPGVRGAPPSTYSGAENWNKDMAANAARLVGQPYTWGHYDCSGVTAHLWKPFIQDERLARTIFGSGGHDFTAESIIVNGARATGHWLKDGDLAPGKIGPGVMIGTTGQAHAIREGRAHGIGHIVSTFMGEDGVLMVAESTSKRDRQGRQLGSFKTMPYSQWWKSHQNRRLYGVDISSLAGPANPEVLAAANARLSRGAAPSGAPSAGGAKPKVGSGQHAADPEMERLKKELETLPLYDLNDDPDPVLAQNGGPAPQAAGDAPAGPAQAQAGAGQGPAMDMPLFAEAERAAQNGGVLRSPLEAERDQKAAAAPAPEKASAQAAPAAPEQAAPAAAAQKAAPAPQQEKAPDVFFGMDGNAELAALDRSLASAANGKMAKAQAAQSRGHRPGR